MCVTGRDVRTTPHLHRLPPPKRAVPFLPAFVPGGAENLNDAFLKSARFFAENKPVDGQSSGMGSTFTRRETFTSVALAEAASVNGEACIWCWFPFIYGSASLMCESMIVGEVIFLASPFFLWGSSTFQSHAPYFPCCLGDSTEN